MVSARIFYVIGPSGSGKDSLLRYARERLTDVSNLVFAHRYITRPVDGVHENHVYLSEYEFRARLNYGFFAMHWQSHGFFYGIGCEIDCWLAKGCHVVINGSRGFFHEAKRLYPTIFPVYINASTSVLRDRLKARGRESGSDIEARLVRDREYSYIAPSCVVIDNDGDMRLAGDRLVSLFRDNV